MEDRALLAVLLLAATCRAGDLAQQLEALKVVRAEVQIKLDTVLPPLTGDAAETGAAFVGGRGGGARTGRAPTFLVVGDWGQHDGYAGQFERDQARVARGMARVAARRDVSFVVSTGDDFYPRGVTSSSDVQFETKWRARYAVGALKKLEWYNTLGDHDCYGNVSAIVEYARRPSPNRFRMGARGAKTAAARYYSVHTCAGSRDALHLLFLDTCALLCGLKAPKQASPDFHCDKMDPSVRVSDRAAQLHWIKRELARSRGGTDAARLPTPCGGGGHGESGEAVRHWRVVFGHAPLLSAGKSHGTNAEMVAALMPLFRDAKVHAYFNGHDHSLQHLVDVNASGTNFFVSGAGGGAFLQDTNAAHAHLRHATKALGFMAVDVHEGTMGVEFVGTRAKTMYAVNVEN